MAEFSLADKMRFVSSYGKIKKNKEDIWVFTASPHKGSPCLKFENASKWVVIEMVFQLIREYK